LKNLFIFFLSILINLLYFTQESSSSTVNGEREGDDMYHGSRRRLFQKHYQISLFDDVYTHNKKNKKRTL